MELWIPRFFCISPFFKFTAQILRMVFHHSISRRMPNSADALSGVGIRMNVRLHSTIEQRGCPHPNDPIQSEFDPSKSEKRFSRFRRPSRFSVIQPHRSSNSNSNPPATQFPGWPLRPSPAPSPLPSPLPSSPLRCGGGRGGPCGGGGRGPAAPLRSPTGSWRATGARRTRRVPRSLLSLSASLFDHRVQTFA